MVIVQFLPLTHLNNGLSLLHLFTKSYGYDNLVFGNYVKHHPISQKGSQSDILRLPKR